MERSSLHTPTCIFLVLLRLAIGWHFAYEGWSKLESHRQPKGDSKPWSAEGYLRNATGPLASYYRKPLNDPDGLERLKLAPASEGKKPEDRLSPMLVKDWDERVALFRTYYEFTEKQNETAKAKLAALKKNAGEWLEKNQSAVADYEAAIEKVRAREQKRLAEFETDRLYNDHLKGVQTQRQFLVGKLDEWSRTVQGDLSSILTPEQREKAKPEARWQDWTHLDWINRGTMYGLIGVGLCLMFGLFTRLAALLGALFLASLYLAMPPWPGMPGASAQGGHYFYVNLQLIEMLAVLAVAGSGRWAGLDALICGALFGKRSAASRV